MAPTDDLIGAAARRYDFRPRKPSESSAEYRGALIRHVSQRDFAAAHELRLNKRQSEWTSREAQSFREHLQSLPRSSHEVDGAFLAFPVMEHPERLPASDDTLLTMAQRGLSFCRNFRTTDPTKEFAPMISVLLTDGRTLHALPGREDRIRAIKLLSRQYPVHGFVLAADVFIHRMDHNPVTHVEHASKQDAFVVHVGSRTLRRIFVQVYRVELAEGFRTPQPPRVIWEPVREPMTEDHLTGIEDPYADVFVSVPVPKGKPS